MLETVQKVAALNASPQWVKDAVFYQIFPDRFARGQGVAKPSNLEPWDTPPTRRGFKGGDLRGIAENMDYLEDLGIGAIYLTPVFQSASNHRYNTYDYYQVDPMLGGNQALAELLDRAHSRGIRVLLDGVFNHCGRGFYQFHHILETGRASPYLDWFLVKRLPMNAYSGPRKPYYQTWRNVKGLPKFNLANADVRRFLLGVARHWIEFGIDGWRLDVPEEITQPDFWPEFRNQVKTVNPEACLIGEIWHRAPEWLQGDRFDSLMNYPLTTACARFFAPQIADPALVTGLKYGHGAPISAEGFARAILRLQRDYGWEATQVLLNLLGSHDTPRFLTLARGDKSALRMATLFQMTYPGVPCIYYGDEVGLEGRRDPDCRGSFTWDESNRDTSLREYFRQCIALRRAHPALRSGKYTAIRGSDGVFAFGRRLPEESVVVAFNTSHQIRTVELGKTGYLAAGSHLREVWSGRRVPVLGGPRAALDLPPRSGTVWLVESSGPPG